MFMHHKFTIIKFKQNSIMKNVSLVALFVFALASMAFTPFNNTNPDGEVASYNVDTESSAVIWKAYKVTGSHTGTVKINSGSLQFQDGMLSGGQFEIDMQSIKCTDLDEGTAPKLEGHLKSPDFFGVESYPTAKFVITNVFPNGVNRYKVTGNLTIKETTKEIKFIANLTEEGDNVTAKADVQVDRSDYDVRYGSGTFFSNLGDNTIYDEFDLEISLVAAK